MEKLPFFSIILPTYNRANLLPNAIQSVINQSFEDWELIIVDDGSSDHTNDVVQKIKDIRIKYLNKGNQGKGGARNLGIDSVTGEYICFLDDDDIFYVNHLEILHAAIIANSDFKVFRTGICFNLENGIRDQEIYKSANKEDQLWYLWTHFFCLQNMCLLRGVAEKERFSDLELWEDKQYLQKILFNETYFQANEITIQLNDGPHRSVNNAYNNLKKIEDQVQVILNSYDDLHDRFPSVAKKINIREYVAKTYLNHAISARKNNDRRVFLKFTKKIISMSRNPATLLRLLKAFIN